MRDAIDSNGNARPPARRKLTLLVGHDTNVSNIGGMLGMHWALPSYLADQTPPAGALHFEVLCDRDSGSYAVRVSYIAQTLDQMRHAVRLDRSRPPEQTTATIEGCPTKDGETCAWPTFDALASKAIDHACLGAQYCDADMTSSCLISCSHWLPEGGLSVLVGKHGAMNPAGKVRCNIVAIAKDYSCVSQPFFD